MYEIVLYKNGTVRMKWSYPNIFDDKRTYSLALKCFDDIKETLDKNEQLKLYKKQNNKCELLKEVG